MSTNKGNAFVDDVKSGFKGIFSAGEAIRGTVNETIDHTFHDRAGEAKDRAIKDKGVDGVRQTDAHFGAHHGIGSHHTTATTTGGTVTTGGVADTSAKTGDTTGAGSHSAAPGSL